jgi:hypothetical protein
MSLTGRYPTNHDKRRRVDSRSAFSSVALPSAPTSDPWFEPLSRVALQHPRREVPGHRLADTLGLRGLVLERGRFAWVRQGEGNSAANSATISPCDAQGGRAAAHLIPTYSRPQSGAWRTPSVMG